MFDPETMKPIFLFLGLMSTSLCLGYWITEDAVRPRLAFGAAGITSFLIYSVL
jgi:hypothetical protein